MDDYDYFIKNGKISLNSLGNKQQRHYNVIARAQRDKQKRGKQIRRLSRAQMCST